MPRLTSRLELGPSPFLLPVVLFPFFSSPIKCPRAPVEHRCPPAPLFFTSNYMKGWIVSFLALPSLPDATRCCPPHAPPLFLPVVELCLCLQPPSCVPFPPSPFLLLLFNSPPPLPSQSSAISLTEKKRLHFYPLFSPPALSRTSSSFPAVSPAPGWRFLWADTCGF